MPDVSFPPLFHEFGARDHTLHQPRAEVIHTGKIYGDDSGNFGEVTSLDPFYAVPSQPYGLAAVGHTRIPGRGYASSRGFLPLSLPDGVDLNSISVMGYSNGKIRFDLVRQLLTYSINPTDYSGKVGQTSLLAKTEVGSSVVRDERDRRIVSGAEFNRTVPIRGVKHPITVDNGNNWYGLWVNMSSNSEAPDNKRGFITGVKITYDEPTRDRWPEESRNPREKYPYLINERSELTVIGPGQTSVGIVRDDELVELDESGTSATTFTLPPGEYELWTDGNDVEIVTEPAPEDPEVTDGLPRELKHRRDDDPTAK